MPIAPHAAASYTRQMMPRRARVMETTSGAWQHVAHDRRPEHHRPGDCSRDAPARRFQPSLGVRFTHNHTGDQGTVDNPSVNNPSVSYASVNYASVKSVAVDDVAVGSISMVDVTPADNRPRANGNDRSIAIVPGGKRRRALEARARSDAP